MSRSCARVGPPLRGATLLECLVGLALGLVVVAALASHYLATGQSARLQAAQAQMSEDAQIGLELLRTDLMMAGYARPLSLQQAGDGARWTTTLGSEAAFFACDLGFVAPASTGAAACALSGLSAALEVRYQADEHNTVPLSGTRRPSDCLGNGLSAEEAVPAASSIYLTHNRWYVAIGSQGRSELRCASRLGNAGQPLVDNVEAMALWFSEAGPGAQASPVRYVKASQVSSFGRVRSVRICLVLRSTDAVLSADAPADHLDCEGRPQASADRRLRRAFHTTVALRSPGRG